MGVIRSGSVSIVLCITLSVACARIANQTNNIGSPCKSEADCESGLICFQGQTCQEPCLAGNTCKDPTKTCQNGGCVAGGSTSGGDGGGQTPANGFDSGNIDNPGGDQSDGKVVLDGLPSGLANFATDDNMVFYSAETMDGLGQKTFEIQWQKFTGEKDKIVSVMDVGGGPRLDGPYYSNGHVYWLEGTGNPPNQSWALRRVATTSLSSPEDVLSLGNSPGGGPFMTVSGDYVLFTTATGALRVYDAKTSTLDPTTNYAVGATGIQNLTIGAGKIYFVDTNNPKAIWSGTLGAPATKTTATIPQTVNIKGAGASATELFGIPGGQPSPNLVAFNVGAAGTDFRTVFALGGGGGSPSDTNLIYYDGNYAFTVLFSNSGATGEVVRITTNTNPGVKTHVGTYLAQGGMRPVYASNNFVYVLENSQGGASGSRLSQWAKPAP